MDICVQTKQRVKPRRRKQHIKWWRLKDRDENKKVASMVEETIKDIKDWNQQETLLSNTAKSVLGETAGKGAYNKKETWWWNDDVQTAVKEKRLKFEKYQLSRCDKDKYVFREANREIKLMSHFMKLWERIIEARLREIVNIRENQSGFRPGMSTTEPVFALRQLQEKYIIEKRTRPGNMESCV